MVINIIGDLLFVRYFSVFGAAYSSILTNAIAIILCFASLEREGIHIKPIITITKQELLNYISTGFFSGFQIFIDNIMYILLVCRMVNQVREQGNYWNANNLIWGLFLIPVMALSEVIKKDGRNATTQKYLKTYNIILGFIFLLWIIMIPFVDTLLDKWVGIQDNGTIKHILAILLPFYVFYSISQIFDNIFIGNGKTQYLFIISVIINFICYPMVYFFVHYKRVILDVFSICTIFGIGMIVHFLFSILFYWLYKKDFSLSASIQNHIRNIRSRKE